VLGPDGGERYAAGSVACELAYVRGAIEHVGAVGVFELVDHRLHRDEGLLRGPEVRHGGDSIAAAAARPEPVMTDDQPTLYPKLRPEDGWHPDGSGDCIGCGRRTAMSMVGEGGRRIPICAECAANDHGKSGQRGPSTM
jgi:hypothetical protein